MADGEPEPLTYVPETVLKKRKDTEHVAIRRREQNEARKARTKENKKLQFKRAEQFVKEYRLQELDRFRLKRNKKLRKSSFSKSESRLLFVIRIGGTNDMHPKTKKILRLLRLRQICTGVFVILNEQTAKMLNLVEPYVTYGYPNLKSVTELIFKKGVGLVDNGRIPLTENSVIEQLVIVLGHFAGKKVKWLTREKHKGSLLGALKTIIPATLALGKHGIICAEDIIHEISSVGSNFKVVSNFLQPFKLTMPYGRFQNIRKHFKEGGDAGNREDQINDLISRMN